MKKLLVMLALTLLCSSCLGLQIKSDKEILSSTGFIVDSIADYVKYKYPAETESLLVISNKILKAESDELVNQYFSDWIDKLTKDIKDPFIQSRAKALLKSFELDPVTSELVLDSGSLRTLTDLIRIFQKRLED